jgi:hypothetical protein
MSVLPGAEFTADISHYETGAVGELEFRLVDSEGGEALAWSAAAIVQVTAEDDGPDWIYRATRAAPAATGIYVPQWRLAATPEEVWADDDPIVVSLFAFEPPVWAPTPAHVAAILRARTRGGESMDAATAREQGVFTTSTRPTFDQVVELCGLAAAEMSSAIGGRTPCTAALALSATSAAAYRAAMLVEISYFPEQTTGDQTAFAALEKMWAATWKSAVAAILEQCPLTDDEGSSDVEGGPIGCVPVGRTATTWCGRW